LNVTPAVPSLGVKVAVPLLFLKSVPNAMLIEPSR
jgi:hypothetical protein